MHLANRFDFDSAMIAEPPGVVDPNTIPFGKWQGSPISALATPDLQFIKAGIISARLWHLIDAELRRRSTKPKKHVPKRARR